MKVARPRVGILVGHFGLNTGASIPGRDEWFFAHEDAHTLCGLLRKEGKLQPVLVEVDQSRHPWDLVQKVSRASLPTFLGGMGNIDIRCEWAMREGVDAVVELHVNSARGNPAGHEVFIRRMPGPRTKRLGQCLINAFDEKLGNARRGLKHKSYRILRRLHAANIPAAILEPAFIQEDVVLSRPWRDLYVKAIAAALYQFFNV